MEHLCSDGGVTRIHAGTKIRATRDFSYAGSNQTIFTEPNISVSSLKVYQISARMDSQLEVVFGVCAKDGKKIIKN